MTAPYPIYRDAAYLYTLCRVDRRWAITMIPAAQGIRGQGHVYVPEDAPDLPGARWALREYAARYGLTRVTRVTRGGVAV